MVFCDGAARGPTIDADIVGIVTSHFEQEDTKLQLFMCLYIYVYKL